ncbi:MAG: hypothetical protein K2X91_05915, partial [Thermoleophilia bacterium]|nr:hypothetical protein [Thermoleophilia bacterium]
MILHLLILAAPDGAALLDGHRGPVVSLAFGDGGKTLASAASDGVRSWRVADGKPLRHVAAKGVPLLLSPDASAVLSRHGGKLLLRDLGRGTDTELPDLPAAFTADALLMAEPAPRTGEKTLVVRDPRSGKELRRLPLSVLRSGSLALAATPDGRKLAAVPRGERALGGVVIDLRTGRRLVGLPLIEGDGGAAFSPDGGLLAVAHQRGAMLVDPATGRGAKRLKSVEEEAGQVAFDAGGT